MPFTLSHHPLCDRYKEGHYIRVGKYSLCIGCTFTYPTIIVLLILYFIYNPFGLLFERYSWVIPILVIFFLVSYKLDIFDRSIIIKILSKVYLGAVVVLVVLYASYLAGSSIILKVYVAFMTYMIFVSIFSGIRGAKMWNMPPMEKISIL